MVVAFLAALAGLAYSVSFVFIKDNLWNGLFLMLGGLLGGLVLATLYSILKATDSGLALVGLLLATVGMGGAIVHGGYDLALGVNPVPALPAGVSDLPSQVDPRGLLTFGISGLAIGVFTWLMQRSRRFPASLIYTGWLLALLMEILYLGRLIILDAKNPVIVVAALLAGFIVNPLWYVLVGLRLQNQK
jgi:hypothetical protein